MRSLPAILGFLTSPQRHRNLGMLVRPLAAFSSLVLLYTVLFQVLMALEGQEHSWATAVYWVLVIMSTLGLGDIAFQSDAGRIFSVLVLLSGMAFMFVLLPFLFIQFFYLPWTEANAVVRSPRSLPATTSGHVILTGPDAVESALVRLLDRSRHSYVVLVAELAEALRLHEDGYHVLLGDLDDPETYRRARVGQAALVVTTRTDAINTNVALTVRELSESVSIVATAASEASIEILKAAGCTQVLQFPETLGQAFARRILGRDAKAHVIGGFGEVLIAEATARQTPLVGRTLQEIRLREHANVNVVGVWDRGHFQVAGPETRIQATSVLVLAGSRKQLDAYDELFCIYRTSDDPVLIIGGGRVGRAVADALRRQGIDCRMVERQPVRNLDPATTISGDATDPEVLEKAGIRRSSTVVITTHDDAMNVYLTVYCRRVRPDVYILARANLERNVATLHRAGADFVMSYTTTGANVLFNLLQRAEVLVLAEGLDAFRVPVPAGLANRSLAESGIREGTGCNVVAVVRGEAFDVNPDAHTPLPADADLVVIGNTESESRFFAQFAAGKH